jgi:hypothetical protein
MLGKARLKGETPQQTRTRPREVSVFGLKYGKYGKSEPKTSENPLTEISGGWAYIPDIVAPTLIAIVLSAT